MHVENREASLNPKQVKFLLSGALIVIATLVWFLFVAGGAATSVAAYDISLTEFRKLGATSRDDDVRVRGTVEEGSIVQRPGSAEVAFHIVDGAETLKVHYSSREHGALPDTFVDGAAAIVTGTLDPDGVFQAHTIQAKCPSKYEGAQGVKTAAQGGQPQAQGGQPQTQGGQPQAEAAKPEAQGEAPRAQSGKSSL